MAKANSIGSTKAHQGGFSFHYTNDTPPRSSVPHYLPKNPNLRRALALWAVLAVAVCVKTLILGGEHSVYPQFAGSARHWWADMSLYADYTKTEHMDGYRYSPAFAVAFTPFYLLPDRLGLIAWNLLSMGLLAWALHVLVRDVLTDPSEPPWHAVEGTFMTLTLAGSAIGIWSGQSNAVLPALIALGLAAIVRDRWWTASFLLAVPVFIKIWPIAIVLLLMACWPRQLIGRFAAVCIALVLLPFLTRPPDIVVWQYQEWYLALTGPFQGRWGGYRDAWTIWEQLGPVFGCQPDWASAVQHHAYMALQLATSMIILGWCLWQRRRVQSSGHLLMLIFSMWAAWQLLFGPATEQLTYGIIAPATSWAVLVSFAEKKAKWLTVTAWLMLTLLPAGDVEKAILTVFPGGQLLLPLGVVFFIAWLVWHERNTTLDVQAINPNEIAGS